MALAALLLLLAPGDLDALKKEVERNERRPYEQRERVRAIRKLGALGTLDAARFLETLLDDPFAHVRDEAVSALIALKRKSPGERAPSLAFLGDVLPRRRVAETRRHLATALGLIGDPAAAKDLEAALLKERDPEVVAALAQALARLGNPSSRQPLHDKAQRFPKGRAACLRALRDYEGGAEIALAYREGAADDVAAAIVDVLVRKKRPVWPDLDVDGETGERLGIALADALPHGRDAVLARRRAEALLAHSSWRVRAAALAGVERLRDPTLLPDLVQRLEAEDGRLRHEAWLVLRRLTGRDLPLDPEQWRAILPLADLPEGGAGAAGPPETKTTAYFGLPVVSRRIAFVFDVSGSMRDDNKMETARTTFAETAAGLDAKQAYDLFVYRYLLDYPPRPALERCFGKLVAQRAKRAVKWLGKQPAKGGGAIYDALAAAMLDPEVDTVYLLSDGVPSFGTVARDFRVLQEVRRLNRWRRTVIHTILLGERGTDKKFMRELAAATGGRAVDAAGNDLR